MTSSQNDFSGNTQLSSIVVEPKNGTAESCVIWLHGLGADGHDFEGVLPQLNLPENSAIRFVFPTAPIQPVTVNLGQPMTAWYDISHPDLFLDTDWQGIAQSVALVQDLVQQQINTGILAEDIVLAGFSQGGLIALYAALTYAQPLAGVMALSTYFPNTETMPQGLMPSEWQKLKIFYGHGEADPICPIQTSRISKQTLENLGQQVEWVTYPMAHQVCYEELCDIRHFLQQALINT